MGHIGDSEGLYDVLLETCQSVGPNSGQSSACLSGAFLQFTQIKLCGLLSAEAS
jgi:hypothetical protein